MGGARVLFLSLFGLAAACGHQAAPPPAQSKTPPRPSVNHAVHKERELVCIDCHDLEETGTPVMPAAATCFECHENLAEENERVQAYFAATKQPDGSYKFARPAYWYDLTVAHKTHAEKEVACAECHGEPAATAFARPAPLVLKKNCMGCHQKRQASNECAVCHTKTRKDQRPPNHNAVFKQAHGKQAPEGWRQGEGASCALCHAVPNDCSSCHKQTKPRNHESVAFQRTHGVDTDAWDAPWDRNSCALCHERESCVRCHQTKQPRSHTQPWMRRLHGISAQIERQDCRVCHQQDFCSNCHQQQQPVTHRGQWGRGQQSHCVACHEPLTATGCFTCHKSTLGHLAATALPADAQHAGAQDPMGCQQCHPVLPHFDSGGRCRSCHR